MIVFPGGNIKGLYRRGCAKLDMGEWDDAKADLKQCLVLDATNKGAQAALKRVQVWHSVALPCMLPRGSQDASRGCHTASPFAPRRGACEMWLCLRLP